jgi:uncharacterized protein
LIGDSTLLRSLDAASFTNEKFGVPTVRDILAELEKPGRDPRPEFRAVQFVDGVEKISDLVLNQILEGKVTNVTAFGAFVDVGVHQDGLVHISALSDQYVKDPREVVKAGDIVKVKVMAVDVDRKRIGLSMRLSDEAPSDTSDQRSGPGSQRNRDSRPAREAQPARRSAVRPSGRPETQSAEQGAKKRASDATPSALALSLKAALDRK